MKKNLMLIAILAITGCAQVYGIEHTDAKASNSRENMADNWECSKDEFLQIESCKNIIQTERVGFSYFPYRWISINKNTKKTYLSGTLYTNAKMNDFPKYVKDNRGNDLGFAAEYRTTNCYSAGHSNICTSEYIFVIDFDKDYLSKNKNNENLKIKIIGTNEIIEVPNWAILGTIDYFDKIK